MLDRRVWRAHCAKPSCHAHTKGQTLIIMICMKCGLNKKYIIYTISPLLKFNIMRFLQVLNRLTIASESFTLVFALLRYHCQKYRFFYRRPLPCLYQRENRSRPPGTPTKCTSRSRVSSYYYALSHAHCLCAHSHGWSGRWCGVENTTLCVGNQSIRSSFLLARRSRDR